MERKWLSNDPVFSNDPIWSNPMPYECIKQKSPRDN